MATELRLRPLRDQDHDAALAAHAALALDHFGFLLGYTQDEPWDGYVQRLEEQRRGLNVPPKWVPNTFLVAVVGPELVGRVSIRHQLNEYLASYGGHIGYGVVPEHRRRGYATEILRQALVIARSVEVDRVLITCDDDNIASAAVIERCGGIFDSLVDLPDDPTPKRRYWIP